MPIALIYPVEDTMSSSGEHGLASGIWTSVSGAAAQAQVVDMTANNLANLDTAGFKKDGATFKEYLSSAERNPSPQEIPRGAIKDKDFYPLDGRDQAFVTMTGTYTHFKPGSLKVTQSPLDLAVDGPGFFEVSTPSGVRYTKQGSFKVAADGLLVTKEGYPVLSSQPAGLATASLAATAVQPGQGGPSTQGRVAVGQENAVQAPAPEVVARYISMKDTGPGVSITQTGDIYAKGAPGENERLIAKIGISEFEDMRKLRKQGNQLFENPDSLNRVPSAVKSAIHQGVLETSNVNPVEEMTNLIKANRLFEHDLKVMKTYGEIMGKEANDIGKL